MSDTVQEYMESLTDDELKAAFKAAEADLAEASTQEPNSEWHQSCFAGLVLYGAELTKRGIRLAPLH
jgi:hypothetical protein